MHRAGHPDGWPALCMPGVITEWLGHGLCNIPVTAQ